MLTYKNRLRYSQERALQCFVQGPYCFYLYFAWISDWLARSSEHAAEPTSDGHASEPAEEEPPLIVSPEENTAEPDTEAQQKKVESLSSFFR